MFYKVIRKISKVNIMDGARDFRMMTRQMTDAVLSLREYNRFSKGIFAWVGFNTKWIPFENRNREAGTTKWSFWGLLVYAIDGILAFSTAPLALSASGKHWRSGTRLQAGRRWHVFSALPQASPCSATA